MSPSRSTADAESPDSPSSPTPPSPTTTAASRLFAPIPSSALPTSETDPSPSSPGEDAPSWSTSETNDPYSGAAAESSATPSTGSDLKVSKAGLRAAIGTGFRSGCRLMALFIASQEERQYEVWTPDDEDVQGVARPAANIVYRRLPDEAKGGDVIDLFSLGLALVGYVTKNLHARGELRTMLALQEIQGEAPREAGASL